MEDKNKNNTGWEINVGYGLDVGDRWARKFELHCSGVWEEDRIKLPPKARPIKILYKTSEHVYWDYRGLRVWWRDTEWI